MWLMYTFMLLQVARKGNGLLNIAPNLLLPKQRFLPISKMSTSSIEVTDVSSLSWSDLETMVGGTAVGTALNNESTLRLEGKGSPHVQNKLRKFDSNDEPDITFFRDHAGW
jgi:hypothetical protein